MNILCLDQFSELGGAQRCLLELLPAFAERGWSAHLAAPGNGELFTQAAALHATTDRIQCGPYSSGRKSLADMARFARDAPRLALEISVFVRRYDTDLIYVNGPRLMPAVALSARHGPPVLFHSHSFLNGYARRLAGRSLSMARAALVASCRFVALPLLPYCGDRGMRVVYNGVRQMASRARTALDPEAEFRIGVIGRISPEKGQADFLRAARMLHQALPHCRFVICGAPLFSDPAAMLYRAELEALSKGLPVEFAGWQEDVDGVLASLDLLVVPSAPVDATPRVILEAFAGGVPVLAFASGGIPEIVEHDVTGFLVEERSPRALASAIHGLLGEPCLMREVAERALAKARGELSLARYQEEMLAAMEAARRG
jgi:glycosyltransferase involved in cell wall biosynthesis